MKGTDPKTGERIPVPPTDRRANVHQHQPVPPVDSTPNTPHAASTIPFDIDYTVAAAASGTATDDAYEAP